MTKTIKELPSMSMDNFEVKVTARGPDLLKHAVELAMCGAPGGGISGYAEVKKDGVNTLELYWHTENQKDAIKFPYLFKLEQLLPFLNGWLENQDYGKEDNFDGHSTKGWKLYNFPHRITYVVFVIQPEWAEHHK